MFFSSELFKDIEPEYRILSTKLRKQMEDNKINQGFKGASGDASAAMNGMLITTMIMNLLMQGAMGYMIQWINSLQMIIHLPMLKIIVPANVSEFFSLILPIVMFDIIESGFSTELVFEFDDEAQEELQDNILD